MSKSDAARTARRDADVSVAVSNGRNQRSGGSRHVVIWSSYVAYLRLHHWSKLTVNNSTNDARSIITPRAVAPA